MCNEFAKLPYDLQYSTTIEEYKRFDLSKENEDETKSEYECILDYLENNGEDINNRYQEQ